MPLKYRFQSKTEILAEQESLYIEREGAFYLDAEGVVEKSKVDELRTNNVARLKQVDDLKAKYQGIDPEQAWQLDSD